MKGYGTGELLIEDSGIMIYPLAYCTYGITDDYSLIESHPRYQSGLEFGKMMTPGHGAISMCGRR